MHIFFICPEIFAIFTNIRIIYDNIECSDKVTAKLLIKASSPIAILLRHLKLKKLKTKTFGNQAAIRKKVINK